MMEKGSYDLTFPIPIEPHRQTLPQRWYVKKQKEIKSDTFMAHYQDHAIGCEAWLMTENGNVEYLSSASLRFGSHSGVMMGPLTLVAPFPSLKDEYDDWDKPAFSKPVAASGSQTISGVIVFRFTCVLRVYPFQLARLRRLCEWQQIPEFESFVGAHLRYCRKTLEQLEK